MNQNFITYYELLGIEKTASPDEINKAYKQKAKEYHPDRNDGHHTANTLFQYINDAKEILLDPDKRKAYDETINSNKQQDNSNIKSSVRTKNSSPNIVNVAIGAAVVGLIVGVIFSSSKNGRG